MDTTTQPLASIGIDIGKEVFHVVGFGTDGKIAFRRKIKRLALIETFRRLPPSVVGMEACLSAHFVSRALRQLGQGCDCNGACHPLRFIKQTTWEDRPWKSKPSGISASAPRTSTTGSRLPLQPWAC